MGEDVTYPSRDGEELTGYRAWPSAAADSPLPGLIVLQEWWGLNEHIKDVTRRFAAAGYVALAPDLYHGAVATEPDEARKLVMALDMPEAVAEIGQAIEFLLAQASVRGEKAGVVGFCMGGRLVLASALALDTVGAAAPLLRHGPFAGGSREGQSAGAGSLWQRRRWHSRLQSGGNGGGDGGCRD